MQQLLLPIAKRVSSIWWLNGWTVTLPYDASKARDLPACIISYDDDTQESYASVCGKRHTLPSNMPYMGPYRTPCYEAHYLVEKFK